MPIETRTGLKVVVSIAQRAVLVMLSERGRRVIMNPTQFKPHVTKGLEDLREMNLININTLVSYGDSREYELTDLGVQVVDQIYADQKKSESVQTFSEDLERKLQNR